MNRKSSNLVLLAVVALFALSCCAPAADAGWWWAAPPAYAWDGGCCGAGWHGYHHTCHRSCYSGWTCWDPCWGSCYSSWSPATCCDTGRGYTTTVSPCGCNGGVSNLTVTTGTAAAAPGAIPTPPATVAPTLAPIPPTGTTPGSTPPATTPPVATPPATPPPAGGTPPLSVPGTPEGGLPLPKISTWAEPTSDNGCLLTVYVPYEAKVTINGLPTKSTGSRRQFVSYGLKPGMSYTYEVVAKSVVYGQLYTESKTVSLTAGERSGVAFGFNYPPPTEGQTASNY